MRSGLLIAGLAALLMVISSAQAKDTPTSKPAKADGEKDKSGLTGHWAMIAGQIKLPDDVKAKIAEKTKPLTDWDAANKEKLTAAETAVKEAKAAKDKAALAKAEEVAKPLQEERKALAVKVRKDVMGVLTDDQKVDWVAAETGNNIKAQLSRQAGEKIELTAEQTAKFNDLAKAAAKDILALKEGDEKGGKAIREKLLADVKEKVLTDEQRKNLEAKPTDTQPADAPKAETPRAKSGAIISGKATIAE